MLRETTRQDDTIEGRDDQVGCAAVSDENGITIVPEWQSVPEEDVYFGSGDFGTLDGYSYYVGSGGDDFIVVYGGNNYVDGGAGDDIIGSMGDNADKIYGGAGDDMIDAGPGNDYVHGGADNDIIYGGYGEDSIFGDSGDDAIYGGHDNDVINGGSGEDYLDGGSGDDQIEGGPGADFIDGGLGEDTFVYTNVLEFGDVMDGVDTTPGASDVFDFSKLFDGAVASVQQAIAGGYLQWIQSGANVLIQIDLDGGGDGFVTAATLLDTDALKIGSDMFMV